MPRRIVCVEFALTVWACPSVCLSDQPSITICYKLGVSFVDWRLEPNHFLRGGSGFRILGLGTRDP